MALGLMNDWMNDEMEYDMSAAAQDQHGLNDPIA